MHLKEEFKLIIISAMNLLIFLKIVEIYLK